MIVAALTGGIGCGKSAVAAIFRSLGAATVDADQIARDVVAPGTPGLAAAIARFGAPVLAADGSLDRAALGALVFRDPQARRDLEAIIHPHVYQAIGEWIAAQQTCGAPLLIVEVPLLFESEAPPIFAATICVTAAPAVQVARVKVRSGYSDEVVQGILAAQMDPVAKAARADYVIDNGGAMAETRRQVEELFRRLTAA
jgi:dephospho-CoA kinase